MAQKYRKIDPRIWDDEVFDELTAIEALAAFWVLTCHGVTRCGVVVAGTGDITDGLRCDTLSEAVDILSTVCSKMGWPMQKVSRSTIVVILPSWFRHNPPTNEKHLQGMLTDLADVPRCDVLTQHYKRVLDELPEDMRKGIGSRIDTLSTEDPHRVSPVASISVTVTEAETVTVTEDPPKAPLGASPSDSASPRRKGFDPSSVPLPESLGQHAAFRSSWADWLAHRREIRKPLTKTSTAKQLEQFAGWGVSRSVAAIQHTIANGWQGIREPDQARGSPAANRARGAPPDTIDPKELQRTRRHRQLRNSGTEPARIDEILAREGLL